MSQPAAGLRSRAAAGATVFAARDPFTLGDVVAAWREGRLWRPPARSRVVRLLGAVLVYLGFCLFQLSLAVPAAEGYALVLLLAGAIWLVTRLRRAGA